MDPFVSSFEHDGQIDGTGPVPFDDDEDDEGPFGRGVNLTVISFFRLKEEQGGQYDQPGSSHATG